MRQSLVLRDLRLLHPQYWRDDNDGEISISKTSLYSIMCMSRGIRVVANDHMTAHRGDLHYNVYEFQ
jgi:hypothetical protein